MAPHEQYLELCAISIAGELTVEEREKLADHLRSCAECRRSFEELKAAASVAVGTTQEELDSDPGESPRFLQRAETAFFKRFDAEGGFQDQSCTKPTNLPYTEHRDPDVPSSSEWGQLWLPVAAMLVFGVALGIAAFQIRARRGADLETAHTTQPIKANKELKIAQADQEHLQNDLGQRDREIADLKKQISELSAGVKRAAKGNSQEADSSADRLDALQRQLEISEQEKASEAAKVSELNERIDALSNQLRQSEANGNQQKLELSDQEAAINRQKTQLDDQQVAINRQLELLSHDRDVREVMGARDLYVADLFDIGDTGETNKPYGRLFYTKGRSLIFYAFDLDQSPGLQAASTFQAWGQRGPDKRDALNLGILYEDNAVNKRWVLKCNDPNALAQINAVFVTVEPDAKTHQPRGKQVLFAYLRVNPNHP
jgi:hypothetical protein